MNLAEIKRTLKDYDGKDIYIMEVCGSHTAAISRFGIPNLLSEKIHLVSGPGCPVCVTSSCYIDKLIEMAKDDSTAIVSFGDLIRVPGSESSLSIEKGKGADVRIVYSPMEIIEFAKDEPGKIFVFAAIGFETTTPVYSRLVAEIHKERIRNVKLLTSIKTMPPVIDVLMSQGAKIDAFLAPGHVSVVRGSEIFVPLAEKYSIPFAVAGFTGERILLALYDLIIHIGHGIVRNDYPSVVKKEGNKKAWESVRQFFSECDATWRGLGVIPNSGLRLKKEFEYMDAGSDMVSEDKLKNENCRCGDVLCGRIKPYDCPLYKTVCTPVNPMGACMVSAEGNCFSYFTNNREI